MSGCRPLTQEETLQCSNAFQGRYHIRDKCLFVLGVLAGFRIKEMLSLRVKDVVVNKRIRNTIQVKRRFMKGKHESRSVYLAPAARSAILEQVKAMVWANPETYLFKAQGDTNKPISYERARMILMDAMQRVGVAENVGTHTLRKTFADMMYDQFIKMRQHGEHIDPFMELSQALGHKDPKSTTHYITFRDHYRKNAIVELGGMFD
ncbi:tyrosine-type recombinase/integrase [Halodesulfovibrio aestuarii]|uniref:Tyrosine-type recombinase/integrase n=1 Tax=Halodesulfovibrio aestuarii TaxID=126333 RepID=A0ABV4JQH5_9BACT